MRQAVARQNGFTEDLAAKVSRYESEDLPAKVKAALRLADAWLRSPADLSKALVEDVRAHLTQAEIVDLITELWKNSRNKMYVAFGMGPPINPHQLTYVAFDQATGKILAVDESDSRAL